MQDYLHLSYVSRLCEDTDLASLIGELARFREKNLELGITGCIAFENDQVMQVLEGRREAVADLFETIRRDTRHTDVIELERKPVERISFLYWGMVRRPISDVVFLTQLS